MSNKHDEDKKKRSKSSQKALDKYLTEKFAELSRGQELIPVILDRATWEGIVYSINLALKLEHKRKKHGNETKSSETSTGNKKGQS